jgi:hypothetical protein
MNGIMETVCEICTSIRRRTQGGVSFQKLLAMIRKELKLHEIDLKIKTVKDKNLNTDVFYVNGFYDPEDDKNNECPIELIITHNFNKNGAWHEKNSTELLIQIYDSLIHEYRHQGQYRKRSYKSGREHDNNHGRYLSDPDEIDAYSISIAFELCRNLGKHRALRYLHNTDTLSRLKLNGQFVAPSLGMYKTEFPKYNDPVINRLTKKVYTRLQKVDTDLIFM